MTCASCVHHIEKSLIKHKGINHVLVGLMIEKGKFLDNSIFEKYNLN